MPSEYQKLMEDINPLKKEPLPVETYRLTWKSVEGKRYLKAYEEKIKDFTQRKMLPTEYFSAPLGVQLELTNACNLKCIQCYNNSGKKLPDELTISEWVDIIKELGKMRIFECVILRGRAFTFGRRPVYYYGCTFRIQYSHIVYHQWMAFGQRCIQKTEKL